MVETAVSIQNDIAEDHIESKEEKSQNDDEPIVLVDAKTNTKRINKSAYAKLQRSSLSATPPTSLNKLKDKFESNPNSEDNELMKARTEKVSASDGRRQDVNSNHVGSSEDEEHSIVLREKSSESEEDIKNQLDEFIVMEPKVKDKNKTKLRRIFSWLGKDKKKNQDETNKYRHSDFVNRDNSKNETNNFSRDTKYRHTIVTDTRGNNANVAIRNKEPVFPVEQQQKFARQHIENFDQIRRSFDKNSQDNEVKTNKSSEYANTPYLAKYVDINVSTSESDKENPFVERGPDSKVTLRRYPSTSSRDTPPRAQETRQNVSVVNPKAIVPTIPEKPPPNQLQNVTENEFQPRLEETYGTVFDSIDRRPFSPKSNAMFAEKLKLPSNRDIVQLEPRVKSPLPHNSVSSDKIIATELLKKCSPLPEKKLNKKSLSPSHQNLELQFDYPSEENRLEGPRKPTRLNVNISPAGNSDWLSRQPSTCSRSSSLIVEVPRRLTPVNDLSQLQHVPITPPPAGLNVNISPAGNSDWLSRQSSTCSRSSSLIVEVPRLLTPVNDLSQLKHVPITPPPVPTSPQKDEMRKSVEKYYWNEVQKLKEVENSKFEKLYQSKLALEGELMMLRRSRSQSPNTDRARRSLSLPRTVQTQYVQGASGNSYVVSPDYNNGRAIVNLRNAAVAPRPSPHQYANVNLNFVRNSPERQAVHNYENYSGSLYRPIFRRGSLTMKPPTTAADHQLNKKVSFSRSMSNSNGSWPTKNGYTKSPPQRRPDKVDPLEYYPNERVLDDDEVFLPQTKNQQSNVQNFPPNGQNPPPNGHYDVQYRMNPNIYATKSEMLQMRLRSQQEHNAPAEFRHSPQGLTRHGSIIVNEQIYVDRPYNTRRMSFDSVHFPDQQHLIYRQQQQQQSTAQPRRREIIIDNDDVFGTIGGYSVQPRQEPIYGQQYRDPRYAASNRQVNVRNKVCDFYGQIHDKEGVYGEKSAGVMMGQLQYSPNSPSAMSRNNGPFVRGSRFTASAHELDYQKNMYVGEMASSRPLPPIPKGRLKFRAVSDTESTSDNSEIHRIMNQQKNRTAYGK